MIIKGFRITAILLSLVFVAVLLEITLRVTSRNRYPKGYYRVDPNSGLLSSTPNYEGFHRTEYGRVHIKNNRYGFRGQFLNPLNHDVRRILILGDSFVQAAQINYEKTLGYVLQSRINDAQVMQVGIPGWGQGDQLRWLKTYYEELKPYLVILAVFSGNDLSLDNMKKDHLGSSGRVVTRDGDLLGGRKNDPVRVGRRLSLNRSYAYTFIRHRLKVLKRSFTTRAADTQEKQAKLSAKLASDQRQWRIIRFDRDSLRIYNRDPKKHLPYYNTFFELVEEFKVFCTEKDMGLIVIKIPWYRDLDEDLFAAVLDHFGLDPGDYDAYLPQKLIGNYMQRINLSYIDLQDHFIRKSNPLDAYGNNPHFSPTGHIWTAEALHALILQLGAQSGKY